MSEVDRLSNSGLYPALPIADKNLERRGSRDKPTQDPKSPPPTADGPGGPQGPRPPKSIIDEYA